MAANVFFSVLLFVLLLFLLQGFFVLLSVYPQVVFGFVVLLVCVSAYYDYVVGGER